MIKTNDQIYAFPFIPAPDGGPNLPTNGMTLRDYFAAKAMAGFLANPMIDVDGRVQPENYIADWSYRVADAMLEARSSK